MYRELYQIKKTDVLMESDSRCKQNIGKCMENRRKEAIAKRLVKLGKFKALDDVPGYIEYRQAEAKKKGGTYTPREARGR